MINDRAAALEALMALPDPPELHRGHYQTIDGKPDRFAKLLRIQPVTYTQYLLPEVVSEAVERLR